MAGRMRRRTRIVLTPAEVAPWGRGKLFAALGAALAACLLVLFGLGMAVYHTINHGHHNAAASGPTGTSKPGSTTDVSTSPSPGTSTSQGPGPAPGSPAAQRAAENVLASKRMPQLPLQDAQPGAVSTRDPGSLVLPPSTANGPAGVPTGFPHTPAGALAQLAAIDQTAMQSGSLSGTRAVIAGWSSPGGPTTQSWSGVKAMAQFLSGASLSGEGSPQLALVVTPVMGMIKGTVGPDFVVPCVDLQFDVTLQSTQHIAEADCQRMVWRDTRWVIGPGAEPAQPPSVWADTDPAVNVGYKDLRHG